MSAWWCLPLGVAGAAAALTHLGARVLRRERSAVDAVVEAVRAVGATVAAEHSRRRR